MVESDEMDQAYWEAKLSGEGMPAQLPKEPFGKQIPLGDGLGIKSDLEEQLEDGGGHSPMCPIILGVRLNGDLDQPNDRPVEDVVMKTTETIEGE